MPLVSSFILSDRTDNGAFVEPIIEDGGYTFMVQVGKPRNPQEAKNGTKLSRGANFRCLMSGTPITGEYIMAEGRAGRIGSRLMAMVVECGRGRIYLSPSDEMEAVALQAEPEWKPEVEFFQQALGFRVGNYGMTKWSDLFTARQLVALTTFSDLVLEARERAKRDALAAGVADSDISLAEGGTGATAYADTIGIYLGIALSRLTDICNALCRWEVTKTRVRNVFGRQAISMLWDFAENNVFGNAAGDYIVSLSNMAKALDQMPASRQGFVEQAEAQNQTISTGKLVSTDPPYYDNVGYADLSDFFYVWLRRSLRPLLPNVFATVAVPKTQELVATPSRHGGRDQAEAFFLDGMTQAMHRLAEQAHPAFPITIYYAFKQSENDGVDGTASTGWETFLDAVIRAGFAISGTWPMRTELGNRMRGTDSNALASSIILVCRPHAVNAPSATRREFFAAPKTELPKALIHLQHGNIAPVDLAQAAIGPGMAVYTRYAKVLDAEGKSLSVRQALGLINQTLDEALAEQEGDFDPDTRWALTWFEQCGFAEGDYGVAEQLSKSKNTSVAGMVHARILASKAGKVRLFKPKELTAAWDPITNPRLTAWEIVHQLIRALEAGGESAAATLVAKLEAKADVARELAYRLYTLCERKKRAVEALSYNGLVQSWPEIARLAREGVIAQPAQAQLFQQE